MAATALVVLALAVEVVKEGGLAVVVTAVEAAVVAAESLEVVEP